MKSHTVNGNLICSHPVYHCVNRCFGECKVIAGNGSQLSLKIVMWFDRIAGLLGTLGAGTEVVIGYNQ